MIEFDGTFFPDGEQHLPDWMSKVGQRRNGKLQYQYHKYEKALRYVTQRRVAVDVGAHVGQWSRNMAIDFRHVHAFEPVPRYQDCWDKNLGGHPNATLHRHALGALSCRVSLLCGTPGSFGDTFVEAGGRRPDKGEVLVAEGVQVLPLDSLALEEVDFIKIDCEGYEEHVVKGAERTIRTCRPTMIVEQKPGHAQRFGLKQTGAVQLLRRWGMRELAVISGDHIMGWTSRR
jgi:FkbM family methyltransferase